MSLPVECLGVLVTHPTPWEFDHLPHTTRPRESAAQIYAADSTLVCRITGIVSHALADLIVRSVNTASADKHER